MAENDQYEIALSEVARDLELDPAELREKMREWLGTSFGSRRQMIADSRMTRFDDAACYAVYRLTKSGFAFDAAIRTIDRRSPLPKQREAARVALLHYMEWWSEERYAAGWLSSLAATMAESGDEAYAWLVEVAGGTYDDREHFVENANG